MFDWIGAREYGLLCIIRQYWLLRSHLGEEWAENMTKLLERSFPNSDRIDQQLRCKVSKIRIDGRGQTNSRNKHVMSIQSVVNVHFMGKRDHLELVPLSLFCRGVTSHKELWEANGNSHSQNSDRVIGMGREPGIFLWKNNCWQFFFENH